MPPSLVPCPVSCPLSLLLDNPLSPDLHNSNPGPWRDYIKGRKYEYR
jgi:hypothetical protein